MTPSEMAAKIARKMASMGFVPNPSMGGSSHVEYSKTYEKDGRITHVATAFLRDPTGRQEARLDGFVITIQARFDPLAEAVAERAPKICRSDVMEIISDLGAGGTPPPADITEQACTTCGRIDAEFYSVGKHYYCRSCHGKAGTTG